jgi:uncharacterized iron-regulated protein
MLVVFSACEKDGESPSPSVSEKEILSDFAQVVVYPAYSDLEAKATDLNNAILEFIAAPTNDLLQQAQDAWRSTRQPWEQSEAFLFGPVEDFNYDPALDTWPVNRVDLDSLLNSNNSLSVEEIETLPESLKGFHCIEYLLFGDGGVKTAADFTEREYLYLSSLSQNLLGITQSLRLSWDADQPGNFSAEVILAGEGSNRYASQQEAFIAIATAMAGICDEVANGKMEEPLFSQDSTLEESQFAHNSTTDFRNNMLGVLQAYLGKYTEDGTGLNDLVAANNISLDNKLIEQMNAAVTSLSVIDDHYGKAIYTQQVQIMNAQDAINALRQTLEGELIEFIQTNVKN